MTQDLSHTSSVLLLKFLAQVAGKLDVGRDVYVVGGAVRNTLVGLPIKDVDVVVDSVALGRDSAWFASQVVRAVPAHVNVTTNQYGVVLLKVVGSWVIDGVNLTDTVVEIANARKESYAGAGGKGKGYKPTDVQPSTIHEDLLRRDFTVNTLLWRLEDLTSGLEGVVALDLTGSGLRDLKERVLRTPLDPERTFSDDPTRMLRAIRFFVTYGFQIADEVRDAILRVGHKLAEMPHEAVGKILVHDILNTAKGRAALPVLDDLGLSPVIAGMLRTQKPFASFMAGVQASFNDVNLLLDLAERGLGDRAVSFLSQEQRVRLRGVVAGMSPDEAMAFLGALRQAPMDNLALIAGLSLEPRDRGVLAPAARRLMLLDVQLARDPDALTAAVLQTLRR